MLDHPEKTARLIAAHKVAVPFEITLTPEVAKQLQAENFANPVQTYRTVSDLSYAGDEGGSCATSFRWTKNKHSLSPSLMFACRVRCRLHGLSPTTRNIE